MDYLLKSALISVTLFAFYKAFLERETFFQSNRIFFIVGIFTSLLLPLVLIPIEVVVQAPINTTIKEVIPLVKEIKNIPFVETIYNVRSFDWTSLIFSIYWFGVGIFTLKFVSEILTLFYLIYKNPKKRERDYIQVDTKSKTAPFSFFVWIVFNKNQYTKSELKHIISHEKVHVKQWHSADMMFIQLLTIIQWFNPFVWFFKKELQQNLEYIADKNVHLAFEGTTEKESNLKDYQYLLVKTGIGKDPFATTNNFFNSHLKKRIIMLQKSKTNRFNQIKYVLLLPLLALFMYSFSTKEVIVVKKSPQSNTAFSNKDQDKANTNSFILPIEKKKLTRMASGYGMRMHPTLKIKRMHLGVDFSAPKGTAVLATSRGTVIEAKDTKGGNGKIVKIQHSNGYQSNYFHLDKILVKKYDKVEIGEFIGKVGSTGKSTAPHLHFEVLKDEKHINPNTVIPTINNKIETTQKTKKNKLFNEEYLRKIITKNSSTKDINKIIKQFKKLGVTITFSRTKRNDKGEIIEIYIKAKTKDSKANFNANSTKPIDPITIVYENNSIGFYMTNTDKKGKYSFSTKDSINVSKTYTITNNEDTKEDNIRSISIIKSDSLTNSKTMYVITENIDDKYNNKSVTVETNTMNDDNELNFTGTVQIEIDDNSGETTFTIDGEKYSEDEIIKLKEIGAEGYEMIVYNSSDKNSSKKTRKKHIDKIHKQRLEVHEKRLEEQEKRLQRQEELLKRQEELLIKREERLQKLLEKAKDLKESDSGYIQYKGKDYYFNGDDFLDRYGTKVSKKLKKKLIKLKK